MGKWQRGIFRKNDLKRIIKADAAGGITVYLSISLIIIMGLFFTLLESARVYGLAAHSQMESELLIESEMAEYHPLLFDRYHLYLLEANTGGEFDIASLEEDMRKLGNENLIGRGGRARDRSDFYEMQLDACTVDSYVLATDDGGAVYRQQGAEYMKSIILVSELYDWYEAAMQTEEMEEGAGDIETKMECADTEVQNMEAEQDTDSENGSGTADSTSGNSSDVGCEITDDIEITPEIMAEAERTKNPLDEAKELMNKGILSLVVDDVSQVSTRAIDKDDDIAKRECYQGNVINNEDGSGLEEGLFFREYLLREFGNYRNSSEGEALQYAQEYFIAGKSSDLDNLTAVAERLLGIREVVNYLRIHKDTEKVALAKAIALTIGGITLNPAVVAIIREGILAAWAFIDSVQDVKTLLAGGEVPMFDGAKEWSLDYEDYLRILMYLTGEETLAMRSLNYMEKDIRLAAEEEDFRMDCMLSNLQITCTYQAEPLFFGLFGSGEDWNGSYEFAAEQEFVY